MVISRVGGIFFTLAPKRANLVFLTLRDNLLIEMIEFSINQSECDMYIVVSSANDNRDRLVQQFISLT